MRLQARKRVGLIEVERYHASEPIPSCVQIRADGSAYVHNVPQNSEITVNEGDYVRVDNPDDIYPIAADYFAANYDLVEPV